ncbi:MAG: hypothetical protein Q4P36_01215 [Bowdeniella nasicola]|nr:hypothetical protein [Bowdeniella nasicola]
MKNRASHPDDGASLSDAERREFAALARDIGPLSGIGNPRDYTPAPDPDDERFVPPDPGPAAISPNVRVPWILLLSGLVLVVLTFVLSWPWYVGVVAVVASAWAVLMLIWRLPDDSGEREPQV